MPRRLLLILSALSSNFLTNCQTAPPAVPVCVEITMSRGFCVNTISSEEFYVDDTKTLDKMTWWQLRPSMIMMPASSWAKLKTYIIAQCKRTGACDKEITSWNRTIETIDKAVETK